jgi:hypothetical protein
VKYIKTFESYKSKRDEPVNEELFAVYWTSKNMCKAVDEIKKVRWKAYYGTTRHLIEENVFNRNSNSYLFKIVMDDFKRNQKPL